MRVADSSCRYTIVCRMAARVVLLRGCLVASYEVSMVTHMSCPISLRLLATMTMRLQYLLGYMIIWLWRKYADIWRITTGVYASDRTFSMS